MRVLYLSCHSILEYDEISLLTEIEEKLNPGFNVEVFSMGAYSNPTQNADYLRNVIQKGRFYPELFAVAMQCDKDRLHPELVDWADVIISMHNSKIPGQKAEQPWIVNNWDLFQKLNKPVIWRSIGQSVPSIEKEMLSYREKGMKIVRYSPIEKNIPDYAGEDAMIRFSKDPDEFNLWTGEREQVITLAQSFKKRGESLGFSLFDRVTSGYTRKVYGTENADLGDLNGGQRTYEELKRDLREARCFYYFGTQPAPYTLSLIEAMMTGIPVVAVGRNLRSSHSFPWNCYELPDIIQNGLNGYIADDIQELRGYIGQLMNDHETAKRVGEAGRRTAVELFGKNTIMMQWANFLRPFVPPTKI